MSKQFPKLQAKLNEIQIRLNEVLRDEFIDIDIDPIEDVELTIRMRSFIPHSTTTKLCSLLRKSLNETLEPTAKVTLKDVASAQVLLKLGRDHELAINVLTKALESQIKPQESRNSAKEAEEITNLAKTALSEYSSEIVRLDGVTNDDNYEYLGGESIKICGVRNEQYCVIYWNSLAARRETTYDGNQYFDNGGSCWEKL